MNYHQQYDWFPVVGEAVQIRNNGKVIRDGVVDAVTQDDSILWLAAEGAYPRQMVCRAEGFEVWIVYRWDTSGAEVRSEASNGDGDPLHLSSSSSAESQSCLSVSLTSSASVSGPPARTP